MCKYHFQWRLTWQRGVCLISARSHVKKALSRRIRYHSQLTLTRQLCESEHIRIKYQIILYHHLWLSGVENTNHCTAQYDVMIGWNISVCCSVITDVLLYLCSLSVSYIILYLIISVSSPEIFIFASPPDKIVQFSTSTCHTVTDQCSPHCFYEKHRFLN